MSEFGTLNLDEMAQEDARLKVKGGGNNFLDQFVPMPDVKPGQTGSVALRILPPVKGGKLYQYNRFHSMNGRKVHCPRPLTSKGWDRNVPCPVCEYYNKLWKQIDKLTKSGHIDEAKRLKEEARGLKPVERYYYNAIVRSMQIDGKEAKNVGPRILSIGQIVHKMILEAIFGREGDPDSKLGNITDLKNGYDFIIRKEVTAGEENFPQYGRSGFARTTSAAGTPEEIKKWQEGLHDLTKLRNPKDVDYLEKELAIHRGLIQDDSEGFDTEGFDEKWRQKSSAGVKEAAAKATSVTVPANVPTSQQDSGSETMGIEDEDFMKEIEAAENGV